VTDRRLLVYVDLDGVPDRVGRLWARSRKGKEGASFEYDGRRAETTSSVHERSYAANGVLQ
jgi:hypothetical protein